MLFFAEILVHLETEHPWIVQGPDFQKILRIFVQQMLILRQIYDIMIIVRTPLIL